MSPSIAGYSQQGSPFSYTWLFKDRFFPSSKKLSPCDLASLILHEAGHLARQDTTDNEPPDTFRAGAEQHQPLRFPGQEAEGEVAYNVFRWYRAGWGRYTQADPWDLYLFSENALAYVGGNPVRRRDPLGLFAIDGSCNKDPFSGVAGAFDSMCNKTTTEGTPCSQALKGVSLVLFGNGEKLAKCFKKQCSGKQTMVKCDCDYSKGCAQNVKTVGGNIITIGPGGSECPSGKLGSFEETAFHETVHSPCAFGAAEPDTPNIAGKMFKYLEKKCYGWKTP